MADSEFQQRFGGILRLYGSGAADILPRLHLCVVGVGGVGSWVAEALARSGVGNLTLIDPDEFTKTNINRQLPALTDTIGRGKGEVLAERIAGINPDCRVAVIEDLLTQDNLDQYIDSEFQTVIDAIDSARTKAALINLCSRRKQRVIAIGGAGGQVDPLAIRVGDLNTTFNDPLLARTRSTLRHRYGFSRNPKRRYGVPCIYSTEQQVYPHPEGGVSQQKPDTDRALRLACDVGMGACTQVTATFGMVAAAQTLNRLLPRKVV